MITNEENRRFHCLQHAVNHGVEAGRAGNQFGQKGVRAVVLPTVAAALMLVAAGAASAQTIYNPPQLPMDITVFPSRDFASIAGFSNNADVLVQVRRGGVVSDAVGRTNAMGAIEVNHPGGVCWRTVTPDITAGDTVRVTYRDTANNRTLVPPPVAGSGAATSTRNIVATQAFDPGDDTVVIKGKAILPSGSRIPLTRLEVRIVNSEFIDTLSSRISKREIRADRLGGRIDGPGGTPIPGTSGTLVYDSTTGTSFTATFRGLNADERQLAVSGQTRVMGWQQTTTAGDRLGMTIYEVGEIGGPGISGCPPGPQGVIASTPPSPPVSYSPTSLLEASFQGNQPSLKDVTVFPERDFISIDGIDPGTELQVVVRRGTTDKPVIGTARGIVAAGGVFEVNHPGGVCWTGQTPNILPGDLIDVLKVANGTFVSGQTQRVIDAKVTNPAYINADGNIRVNGTATDNGVALPLSFMEQRIINPDFTTTRIGRRDIRADINGGRVDNVPDGAGNLLRTGVSPSNQWRAVYTGLNATEKQLALAGQNRIMAWLSTNDNGDRFGLTISEFGEVGGPGMGACPAPGNASIAIP
ncbi:hypothetical protein ACFPOU_13995 [Massilia jejuensis]|uniref:DUF5666 domain-containing protein n=1 Tax=Massilia jejuensis TaxID=648894 RepID=A0ABW0PHR7_9BURK